MKADESQPMNFRIFLFTNTWNNTVLKISNNNPGNRLFWKDWIIKFSRRQNRFYKITSFETTSKHKLALRTDARGSETKFVHEKLRVFIAGTKIMGKQDGKRVIKGRLDDNTLSYYRRVAETLSEGFEEKEDKGKLNFYYKSLTNKVLVKEYSCVLNMLSTQSHVILKDG